MRSLRSFSHNDKAVFCCSLLALAAMLGVSLCVGVVMYSPADLLLRPDILRYIRFPRVVAALFAGAGLAGAGVIIQSLLGNALAGPNIIGVNSGAGFMTLIAALICPLFPQVQPLAAFLGALCSVMVIYLLSRRAGTSKMTILLAGVVLNSLLNAASLQARIDAAIDSGKRQDAPKILILRTSSSKVKALDSSFMVGGMLQEFGCINIADSENGLLTDLSIEAIINEDPDYIFVTCMGDLEEGQAQLEASLTSNPVWNALQAVQNDRVFYLEKELFHNKPNARWGESYEILAQLLAQ